MSAFLPRTLILISGPRRSGQVCLTFDDGPDPVQTPRVLDELARLGISATFFVIGEKAEQYPQIVRRIADEGHALGNHTWSHRLAYDLTTRELMSEIERTDKLLSGLSGAPISLFRPPRGKITIRQMLHIWLRRQTIVLWSSDPKDYQCESADEVRSRLTRRGLRGGDVGLMHDTRPFAADVLPAIAERARADGLTFVTIPAWLRGRQGAQPSRPPQL